MFFKSYRSLSWLTFLMILLTININAIVNITSDIKFNIALSDVLLPFFLFLATVYRNKVGCKIKFRFAHIWILLLSWIIFVGVAAISNNLIQDAGWVGLIKELIKTLICIVYFFVGYNTLKVLSVRTFGITWVFSALVFILGGFVIFLLAQNGHMFDNSDLNYQNYYMGTDTDPNHAAMFLTITFFSMGVLINFYEKKWQKLLIVSVSVLSLIGLLFTGSRGGVIGFVISLTVIIIYLCSKNWKHGLVILSLIFTVIMIFLLCDFFSFDSAFSIKIMDKITSFEEGFNIRSNLSKASILMGIDHPLLGVGRGNFALNSRAYFDLFGVEFVDNIPHNTYFGLFAETGILGLLLFMMPILLVIYSFKQNILPNRIALSNNMNSFIWMFALMLGVAVQAFVLNIENRRFLWYLSGVLIFLFENFTLFSTRKLSKFAINISNSRLVYLFMSIFVLTTYTVVVVNIPLVPRITSDDYVYILPIGKLDNKNEYAIGVELLTHIKNESGGQVIVNIFEEIEKKGRILLETYEYDGVVGVAEHTFKPQYSNSKIVLEATVIDKDSTLLEIMPLYLRDGNQYYDLTKQYFLQPPMIQSMTITKNKKNYIEFVQKTDLTLGISNGFEDKLIVDTVKVNQDDDFYTYVSVGIHANMKIVESPVIFLRGIPNNILILPESQIPFGIEEYELINTYYEPLWNQDELREFTFKIPRQFGVYSLKLGAYTLNESDRVFWNANSIYNEESIYIDLGYLNLDSIKTSINRK